MAPVVFLYVLQMCFCVFFVQTPWRSDWSSHNQNEACAFAKLPCHWFRLWWLPFVLRASPSLLWPRPPRSHDSEASSLCVNNPWWPLFSAGILNALGMTSVRVLSPDQSWSRALSEHLTFLTTSYSYNSIYYFYCEKSARKREQYSEISAKSIFLSVLQFHFLNHYHNHL